MEDCDPGEHHFAFSGVFGCGLWYLAMLWVDRKLTPAPYCMRSLLLALTAVAGVVMTVVGGWVTINR